MPGQLQAGHARGGRGRARPPAPHRRSRLRRAAGGAPRRRRPRRPRRAGRRARPSSGDLVEVRDAETLHARTRDARRIWLPARPELFIESDAPEIVAEAQGGRRRRPSPALRAERLVAPRQRPPREEAHGQPALRAGGAAHEGRRLQRAHRALRGHGARAGHARADRGRASCTCAAASTTTPGPRSTSQEARGRGLWLPVDPTLNQFPADATHIRLARGGLDRQAAHPARDRPRQDERPRGGGEGGLHAGARRARRPRTCGPLELPAPPSATAGPAAGRSRS